MSENKFPVPFREDLVRLDGSLKGPGWMGTIKNREGYDMTELSVGEPGTEEGFFPLIGPWLTEAEITKLHNGEEATPEMYRKAREAAKAREVAGESPFAPQDYSAGPRVGAPEPRRSRPTKAKKATKLQLIKRLLGFADEPGVIYDHPHANYLPIPGEREARDFLQYRALPLPSEEEVERRKRQRALDAYDYDIREYLAPGEGTVMPTAGRSGWFMPGPKGKPAGFQGDTYRTPAVVGKLPKKE